MTERTLVADNERNVATERNLIPQVAMTVMGLLLAAIVLAACQAGTPSAPASGATPASAPTVPTSSALGAATDFAIVDCLLPGHVRRLGGMVYAGQRRPVRTTGRDCAIRGGEYVLYDPANYATALKIWMPLAEQGDPTAQLYVGDIYERGLTGNPDYAQAANWYRQAANKGSASAKVSLARLYERGQGVEHDVQKAVNLYREAVGIQAPLTLVAAANTARPRQEAARARQQSSASSQQTQNTNRELADAQQRLAQLKKEADEARRTLADARQTLEQKPPAPALVEQQTAPDEVNQRRAEIEALQAELQRRERTIAEQTEALNSRAADVASKETAVAQQSQDVLRAHEALSREREALERARQEIEKQQATLASQEERIAAERGRLKTEIAQGTRIAEQQANVERESQELSRQQAALTEQTAVLDRRAADFDAREAEVQSKARQVTDKRTVEYERAALARQQAEVEAERQRLAAELAHLQKDVPALTEAHRQQGEVIAGLKAAAGERDAAYAQLAARVSQYESELENKKKQIDVLVQHIDKIDKKPEVQVPREVFGRYYALIIGNDDYAAFGSSLKNAQFDARAIAGLLKNKYGYSVIEKYNATRNDILGTLNVLKSQLTGTDNLLVYYAGHGQLEGGVGYWLPVDAEPAPQTGNWISNNEITNILRDMKAKQVLVIADSCYGGSLAATSRPPSVPAVRDEDRIYWIKTLANKPTRMVLTSGSLSPVLDGGGGQHSVFSKALLEVLGTNANIMEGWRVYINVAAQVSDAVKGLGHEQRPTYRSVELEKFEEGEYFFVPG